MGLISGLVFSVGYYEIMCAGFSPVPGTYGLMAFLLSLSPSAPGRTGQLVTLMALLTTLWPSWQVGDILCCISFRACFPVPPFPSPNNLVLSYFPLREEAESGGQNTFWRAFRVKEPVLWHNLSPWGGQTKNPLGRLDLELFSFWWAWNWWQQDRHLWPFRCNVCSLLWSNFYCLELH